jgi:hypothetical protein
MLNFGEKAKKRDLWGDLEVVGRTLLKWILKRLHGVV